MTPKSLAGDVKRMVQRRRLSPMRADLPDILRATGTDSSIELALKSHGLSLTDPYWYRPAGSHECWADINFFDNGWDASFGEAVLARDWDALSRASIEVPDVTCGGWSRKAWVRKGGTVYLLKGPSAMGSMYLEGELLADRLFSRILEPADYTHYEKVRLFGEDYIACSTMLGPNEELVPAEALLEPDVKREFDDACAQSSRVLECYERSLAGLGIKDARQTVAKILVASTLTINRDLHLMNFGAIRNVETGAFRASPLYDYGGAFCITFPKNVIETLTANPTFALIWMFKEFSELEPDWDYSWYDPCALEGFGGELEASLATVEGMLEGYSKLIRQAFELQLEYVNGMVEQSTA